MRTRHAVMVALVVAAAAAAPAGGCRKKTAGGKEMTTGGGAAAPPAAMRIVTIPSARSAAVDFRVVFFTGSVDDPPGKEGLTNLAARMVAEGGTKKRSYFDLLEALHPMAASVDAGVDREMTVFSGRAHKDHLGAFLPLLLEVLLEPRFADEDFRRLKDETLNYLTKTLPQEDDENLGREALDVLLYKGHPYGHAVEGTVKGVSSITLEDVRRHWAAVFSQDRLVVGLGGAVDEGLEGKVRAALAALPAKGTARAPIPPAPPRPEGLQVVIVEKKTGSTAISMGAPVGLTRGHKDFYPLMLAFSCLGEHRQSMGRLFRTIREARGMNYGDYAYIEHFVQDGGSIRPMVNVARTRQEMSVWIRPVQHAHRLFVVKLALRALGEFARGGLTAAELDRTRGFLLGYTRVLEEAMPRRLGYAVDDLFYGIPPFLAGAREAFGRMTLDEVNGAIARNVSFDDLLIVVVTENGAELRDQLAGKKNPPFAYDTPKPAAVLEEDKLVAAFDPGLAAGQITVVPVDSLFAE